MKHLIDRKGNIICSTSKCFRNGDGVSICHVPKDSKDRNVIYISRSDGTVFANYFNQHAFRILYYEVEK